MDESTIVDKLIEFGLTRQESVIYVCLIQNGELTGYEVAKQTGISRSNVYSTLAGLVEKGAAYVLEGNASKYMPVAIEEFCDNKIRDLEAKKKYLVENIPQMNVVSEGYITIEGYKHICDKIYHMLKNAKQRIYLSASFHVIRQWEKELKELADRKIKVVLITDKAVEIEGSILYISKDLKFAEDDPDLERKEQLRLIIDSEDVLTGELSGKDSDTCLYCGQRNFVNVFKEALRNEIKLIELTEEREKNKNEKSTVCDKRESR